MDTNRGRRTKSGTLDPVCGRRILEAVAELQTVYDGRTYRFCCPECKREFDANPKRYASDPKQKKRGGFWSRYLNRLNKTTGGKPQCCH